MDGDSARGTEETGEKLIVITRDADDPGAFARFAKELVDDVVMLLRPVDSTPQRPDVDQVAHHIERLKLVLLQENEKAAALLPRVPR